MVEPEAADEGEDDEDSDAEDDGNDMQLAWEMLELAKLCYSSDASMHKQQLAGGFFQFDGELRSLSLLARRVEREGGYMRSHSMPMLMCLPLRTCPGVQHACGRRSSACFANSLDSICAQELSLDCAQDGHTSRL